MQEIPKQNLLLRFTDLYSRSVLLLPARALVVLALGYHILLGIQGVDLLDEGFHATLYQQFFNDPASVQYAFLYWLSGLFGAAWLKLFPFAGWLGIRIFGAITCTATLVLAYRILKNRVAELPLRTSLILLALFVNNDPKDFYYNNFSAFLYFLAAFLLIRGISGKRNLLVFLGGVVAGINIFNRLPNLLGAALVLLVFYYGWLEKEKIRQQWVKAAAFIAGGASGVLLVLGLLLALGHFTIFKNALLQLFTISSSQQVDDGLKGSYGPFNLLFQSARQYSNSLVWVVNSTVILLLLTLVLHFASQLQGLWKRALQGLVFAIAALLTISLIKDGILNLKLIELFTGLAITGSLWVLFSHPDSTLRLTAATGLFILLVHPFGSAVGIYTVVPYSLWISFPLFADRFSQLKTLNFRLSNTDSGNQTQSASFSIEPERLIQIRTIGALILALGCLIHIIKYPYFYDRHSRWSMRSSLSATNFRGIYTSAPKATLINELLQESKKYVQAGDTVLAYDLIPMYHFWTETKPYLNNPCPWFYSTSVFADELDKAERRNGRLPVVVMQKIRTIGDGSGWPEVQVPENYALEERNKGRNAQINAFFEKHGYVTIWENSVFEIRVPADKK